MHDQQMIFGWTANRSGAAMTIKGTDESGQPIKVSNVSLIGADKLGAIIAITREVGGPRYQLAVSPFRVAQVRAVAGNPLWEVKRIRDNQTMTEPFTSEAECEAYLAENSDKLLREFGA